MGVMSNKIQKEQLKIGDHIYSWRRAYIYAHHGIYVGDGKVIHFTQAAGQEGGAGNVFDSVIFSSAPSPVSGCHCPICVDQSKVDDESMVDDESKEKVDESKVDEESKEKVDDESKEKVDESKGKVVDESKGKVEDESKEKVDDESKENVDDDSKVVDESKETVDDESKEKVDDESKGKVDDESKGKVDDESKGKVDDKSKGKVDDKSKGKVDDESKGKVDDESKEKVDDESKVVDESKLGGVIPSCLESFLSGGDLYRYEYGVNIATFLAETRGGTCTLAFAEAEERVLHRAYFLLANGFGTYDLFKNNCIDFAVYCKTSLLVDAKLSVRRCGQVVSLLAYARNFIFTKGRPLLFFAKRFPAVMAVGGSVFVVGKVLSDIGIRPDAARIAVEDLVNGRR